MRTDLKIVNTKMAPAAIGPYSQGIKYGDVYYFSGQIGLIPETMELEKDFKTQLSRTLKNIEGLLKSEGLTTDHIIKTTIFLTDMSNFPKVNELYEHFFSKPFPARSCVEVSKLPKEALIEIEVIATQHV
jgi:2-iminobutanoate/2-iminopropanoate deaminase